MKLFRFCYKKHLFVLPVILLTCFFSCGESTQKENKQPEKNKKYPKFEFRKEIHKFGDLFEGEIAVCEFYFKNTGKGSLLIREIESDCGCTAFKWNKKPVKEGAESKITVEFDTKGRYGKQYKTIRIYSNALGKQTLKVTANVKP